jgi:hypothetical protein
VLERSQRPSLYRKKNIEPPPEGGSNGWLSNQISLSRQCLLHCKDQVVVIVIGAYGARGRDSGFVKAELRANTLKAASGNTVLAITHRFSVRIHLLFRLSFLGWDQAQ